MWNIIKLLMAIALGLYLGIKYNNFWYGLGGFILPLCIVTPSEEGAFNKDMFFRNRWKK